GGRLRLRAISDRVGERRSFARAVGLRLVGSGLAALASSFAPSARGARHSLVANHLEHLHADARGVSRKPGADIEQEQIFLSLLAVSIWAAAIPWLAGGTPIFAGALSLLALCFPVVFL